MTGIIKSRMLPNSLPWNVWIDGKIVYFCATIIEAGEVLREKLAGVKERKAMQ